MTYISWFSDYTKYVEGYIVLVFPSVRPSFHAAMLHCDLYFMSSDFAMYLEDSLMFENDSLG